MSIASAITAAQGKVANAYTAVSNKGGTLPQTQNLTNLPTAINSIPSGITPSGTLNITENGSYDVSNYRYANVAVADPAASGILKFDVSDVSFVSDDLGLANTIKTIYVSIFSEVVTSNDTIACTSVPLDDNDDIINVPEQTLQYGGYVYEDREIYLVYGNYPSSYTAILITI